MLRLLERIIPFQLIGVPKPQRITNETLLPVSYIEPKISQQTLIKNYRG